MVNSTKLAPLVFDCETSGLNTHKDRLYGIAVCHNQGKNTYWINGEWKGNIEDYFDFFNKFIVAHNGKFDSEFVNNSLKYNIKIDFDTKLAYKLLHIDRSSHLETIVKDLFNIHKKDLIEIYNEVTGKSRKSFPNDYYEVIPENLIAKYAQEDVYYTYKLYEYCVKELDKNPQIKEWFYNVEMPLCNILIKSELQGVKINRIKLDNFDTELQIKQKDLSSKLKFIADKKDLNLNSSKQLQDILYKKFKLPKLKKTKTGTSTDTKTLEKLVHKHKFCKYLLEYREITKLRSAFTEPLLKLTEDDGIIRCWYNQMGTRTRRFSCERPNLQQIPSRTNNGKTLRECFVARPGHKFLIADYSQIELRLLAHFSEEPKLIKAFNNNEDIHKQTAEFIGKKLGKEFSRDKGKLLNFSIIYGKTSFGFSKDWNCSVEEAELILNSYFELYPRVKEWMREQQDRVIGNRGWMKSLAGLPLYVSNTDSNDKWKFEEAKRQAVNYLIQGSSQDILKRAIVVVHEVQGSIPLLIVHDELVYELKDNDTNQGKHITQYMEHETKLKVPIKVDYKISNYWEK